MAKDPTIKDLYKARNELERKIGKELNAFSAEYQVGLDITSECVEMHTVKGHRNYAYDIRINVTM